MPRPRCSTRTLSTAGRRSTRARVAVPSSRERSPTCSVVLVVPSYSYSTTRSRTSFKRTKPPKKNSPQLLTKLSRFIRHRYSLSQLPSTTHNPPVLLIIPTVPEETNNNNVIPSRLKPRTERRNVDNFINNSPMLRRFG